MNLSVALIYVETIRNNSISNGSNLVPLIMIPANSFRFLKGCFGIHEINQALLLIGMQLSWLLYTIYRLLLAIFVNIKMVADSPIHKGLSMLGEQPTIRGHIHPFYIVCNNRIHLIT